MMDFKTALTNAIRLLLPNAHVRRCLFHFSQSLWQKIPSLGLTREHITESNTRKCATMLFGLPFVPLEDVNETSKHIAENAEENLDDLMDYVEKKYAHGRHGRR